MLAIIITDSSGYSHSHYLPENGASYTIGRGADCSFSLPEEATLSNVHCQLTVVDGYVYLQDCGSRNGVFTGTHQVSEEYMVMEREYEIGTCRLMLINIEEQSATTPQPAKRAAKLKPRAVTTAPESAAPKRAAKLKPKNVTSAPPAPQEIELPTPEPIYEESPIPAQPAPEPAYEEAPSPTQPAPEPAYEEAPSPTQPVPEPAYEEAPIPAQPALEPAYKEAPSPTQPAPEPAYEEAPIPAQPAPEPAYKEAPSPTQPTPEPACEEAPTLPARELTSPQVAHPAATPPTHKISRKERRVTVKKAAAPKVHKELFLPEPPRTGALAGLPRSFDLKLRLVNREKQQKVGTALRFALLADCACHIYLLQYDSEGNAGLLVPGMAGIAHSIPANAEIQFPNIGLNEYQLMVEPPTGQETIIALACTHPGNFAKVWEQIVQQSTAPLAPGSAEIRAIQSSDTADQAWASAVIHIQTIS